MISEMAYKKREDPELFGKTVAGMSGAGSQNWTTRKLEIEFFLSEHTGYWN
jgi:hypothetical protein